MKVFKALNGARNVLGEDGKESEEKRRIIKAVLTKYQRRHFNFTQEVYKIYQKCLVVAFLERRCKNNFIYFVLVSWLTFSKIISRPFRYLVRKVKKEMTTVTARFFPVPKHISIPNTMKLLALPTSEGWHFW